MSSPAILVKTHGCAFCGTQGHIVTVETHLASGVPGFHLVGLPDTSIKEARDRVRAAVQSCGLAWVQKRITVNLSPASLPKAGAAFDLAIAVGMLAARGRVKAAAIENCVFVAELGLDGSLRPARAVLIAALSSRKAGYTTLVVARESLDEASLVPGIRVRAYSHLRDLVSDFGGTLPAGLPVVPQESVSENPADTEDENLDLSEVRGQNYAVRGMILAASGGHHLVMNGEPGAGKTMIARRLPTFLPDLSAEDSVEVTAVHSIAGKFSAANGLIVRPPIQSPHHSATMVALIGGGAGMPMPGAVSLAHGGVLFLDEAAEFPVRVLDALRQPLESGVVTIHRAREIVRFPARFQLVMATNPCPCGFRNSRRRACKCSSIQLRRYAARLSGPLMDRVDIQINVTAPSAAALSEPPVWSSARAREMVVAARERSAHRWRTYPWSMNAHASSSVVRQVCSDFGVIDPIETALSRGRISLRGADRVLRLALTHADVAGRDVRLEDVYAALNYRNGEES